MAEQTFTVKLDVLDQASAKLRTFQNNLTSFKKDMASSVGGGGVPGVGGARGGGVAGGIAGAIGGGAVGALAGLTIIGGAIVKILGKAYQLLAEASPYLKSIGDQFQTAFKMFLRPLGDSIAKALQPASEYAIDQAEAMAEFVESADEQFGVIGALIATWLTWTTMQYMAVGELLKGLGTFVWGALEGLGDSLIGLLSPVADWLGDITAGADDAIRAIAGTIGNALGDFGGWLWNAITGVMGNSWSILSELGGWIWNTITAALGSIGGILSGFGSWVLNALISAVSGIGSALAGIGDLAYKAFHNAIASMLNAIANLELPLIGKPFKGLIGEIPMLASGGIVTKPTLAMIGEAGPEAVVPLGRGGGMGNGSTMNVYGNIYGVDDLERTFNDWYSKNQMGYSTYR